MRNGVTLGFALLLAVLLADAGVSYWNVRRLIDNDHAVGRARQVIAGLEEVLALLVDAETGQRGYLLTRDPDFLKPYTQAAGQLPAKVADLRRLADGNDAQQDNVRTLDKLVTARLKSLKESVRRRDQPGWRLDPPEIEQLEHAKESIDAIRATVARTRATEDDELRRRTAESADSAQTTLLSVILSTAASIGLLVLAFVLTARDRERRQRTAEAVRAEREWLHVTLLGIRDAVIATDAAGRVRLLNPVAQALTGWSQEEAVGRPVTDCFRIIHEGTRRPAADPVRRALNEGTVHVLADHTLLLPRGGGELPVELSGGPIRDARGAVVGAVLVFRDVTERRKSEAALRSAAEELARRAAELAEADRRKDNFLALLGHELRNPLAPLRNAVAILELARTNGQVLEQARSLIDRQTRHLTRLVDDLLDASRVANNKIRLRRERLDLGALVRTTAEDQRPILEAAGLTLAADVPAEPLWVEGDAVRLAQVVGNLLHNARKFTDAGGRVEVSAWAAADTAWVRVRDTGTGIDPDMLPRLFEAFSQADRSLDRSRGGLGLGLALVKGLVELHGGGVRAASAGPGRGAEFTFWVPLAGRPEADGVRPPAAGARVRRRILLVEDSRDTADSLRLFLELMGHEVAVAYTGPEGVERARQFRPEVVLCDLGLPGLSGFDVARALRRDPATAAARLISLSGYGREEDRRQARAAGFEETLVKPVDPAELERMLTAGRPG